MHIEILSKNGYISTFPSLQEEIIVADVYIRLFNEQPNIPFNKPTPSELMMSLLNGIVKEDHTIAKNEALREGDHDIETNGITDALYSVT